MSSLAPAPPCSADIPTIVAQRRSSIDLVRREPEGGADGDTSCHMNFLGMRLAVCTCPCFPFNSSQRIVIENGCIDVINTFLEVRRQCTVVALGSAGMFSEAIILASCAVQASQSQLTAFFIDPERDLRSELTIMRRLKQILAEKNIALEARSLDSIQQLPELSLDLVWSIDVELDLKNNMCIDILGACNKLSEPGQLFLGVGKFVCAIPCDCREPIQRLAGCPEYKAVIDSMAERLSCVTGNYFSLSAHLPQHYVMLFLLGFALFRAPKKFDGIVLSSSGVSEEEKKVLINILRPSLIGIQKIVFNNKYIKRFGIDFVFCNQDQAIDSQDHQKAAVTLQVEIE